MPLPLPGGGFAAGSGNGGGSNGGDSNGSGSGDGGSDGSDVHDNYLSMSKADFYKDSGADITITLNSGGNTLLSLKNGNYTLARGTDYMVIGGIITIKASYLATLAAGDHMIVFDMSAGNNPHLAITVIDAGTITDTDPPMAPAEPWVNMFADVNESDWFYDYVEYVASHGLMIGTSTEPMLFNPNNPLTRGMIVTILYRHTGTPDASGLANPFNDVPEGTWYSDAVKWAAANDIAMGYGAGLFGADDNVTRQDLAVILDRYASFAEIRLPAARAYSVFADAADCADYAKDSIERLYRAMIISGYPDNSFKP